MPTEKRTFYKNEIYHIYNRGTQKMRLFYNSNDYNYFIKKILQYKKEHPVKIIAYCIMPNHFHFLIREPQSEIKKGQFKANISNFMHKLQTAYAKYFAGKHKDFSGRVFQGTFKSRHITDNGYYLTVIPYIHNNPFRNGLVEKETDWRYSSASKPLG